MTPFLTTSTFSYNIVYFIFNSWVFISWKKSLYNSISVIFDAYFLNSFIWHKLSFHCLKLDISTWRHYYFVILVSKIQIPVGQIGKQFWYMCSKEPTWLFFFFREASNTSFSMYLFLHLTGLQSKTINAHAAYPTLLVLEIFAGK